MTPEGMKKNHQIFYIAQRYMYLYTRCNILTVSEAPSGMIRHQLALYFYFIV